MVRQAFCGRMRGMNETEFAALKSACEDYVEHLEDDESSSDEDEDYENDIFEKAMMLCLGKNIFDKVNQLIKERDD